MLNEIADEVRDCQRQAGQRAASAADGAARPELAADEIVTAPKALATELATARKANGAAAALSSRLARALAVFRGLPLGDELRALLWKTAVAVLLYVAAVAGREALHLTMPGSVRYLTFFPALLAAGFLCGLFPSLALLVAFMATGFFWLDPSSSEPLAMRLTLALIFAAAGAGVIIPAVYAGAAQRRLKRHEEQLALVNDELRHRLKNLFAVTSSICSQSLKAAAPKEEISRDIIGRIQAVARAQDFLSITSREGSDFRALIDAVIGPLCPNRERVQVAGPAVMIPADSVTAFALVLHELATNAVKYGSWRSDSDGNVTAEWIVKSGQLHFRWREHGVLFSSPARRGFGSKVIQQSLSRATVEHLLHTDGVKCTISMAV